MRPGVGSLCFLRIVWWRQRPARGYEGAKAREAVQVAAALPWATTHHHQTRCFSHLVLHTLLEHFPPQHACWAGAPHATLLLDPLRDFTAANPSAQRLLAACPFRAVPAATACSPRSVLCGEGALAGKAGEPPPLELVPQHLFDDVMHFLQGERRSKKGGAVATGACSSSC
jgi:hypothetical protein